MGIGRNKLASTASLSGLTRETTGTLTYYVTATGSDTNDGLTAETAFATVQHTLDILPKSVRHNIVISIGAGNFNGFIVTGFNVIQNVSLTISGTLGAFAPATGTASGTADAAGGSTSLLVDSDQSWTVNNLRGALLKIGTEYRIVRENTATSITVVGVFGATCNSKEYEIVEQKTVINTDSAYSASTRVFMAANVAPRDGIYIKDLKSDGGIYGFYARDSGIKLERIYSSQSTGAGILIQEHVEAIRLYDIIIKSTANGTYGMSILRATIGTLSRLLVFDSNVLYPIFLQNSGVQVADNFHVYTNSRTNTYGLLIQSCGVFTVGGVSSIQDLSLGSIGVSIAGGGLAYFTDLTIKNVTGGHGWGIYIMGPTHASFTKLTISGCTGTEADGMNISREAVVEITDCTISGNAGYGIKVINKATLIMATGTQTIQTNAGGGILVGTNSYALMDNTDGSNTGYGIIVDSGAQVILDSGTGITGDTGDILVDEVAKTYVSDFNDNKDTVLGVLGSRVQRYDGLNYNY